MADLDFEALKNASARLAGGDATGTGYLVAKQRIATCEHVVRGWPDGAGKVFLGPKQVELAGKVIAVDAATDCAIVELVEPTDTKPLPLAAAPLRKAVWEGFGFPAVAKGAGLPIDGHVADPGTSDDRGVASLLLYSPNVAAGQASPLHGFSGSPVLVQGAVVGHFKKHLGDPDDRARAAYGYVYATPIAAVRELLGDATPELRKIDPPKLDVFSDHVSALPTAAFHVFISYRSTDRAFAKNLTRRLEGAGLRVYLAEFEMRPGDGIVAGLNHALTNSKAAITIVSRSWLESPWCDAEQQYLVGRAIQDPSFRLIALRIDGSQLPALLGSRKFLDVDPATFEDETVSPAVIDDLLWGLIDRPKPALESAASKVGREELQAARHFAPELTLAADRAAADVLAVWQSWKSSGLNDISPALKAAEILVAKARPELALRILDDLDHPGLRASQLRGLALSKSEGRRHEAIAVFERLRAEGHRDPETTGNLAAAYKANFRQSGSRSDARKAYELYLESHEQSGDTWVGINAATLALRAGMAEKARDLADSLTRVLETKAEAQRTHWDWATLAEAYLLAGRSAKAREHYLRASAAAGQRVRDVAVMREGARDDLEALGQDRATLDDCFSVPTVVAFVGHVTDLSTRAVPRFPKSKVGEVRKQIRQRLERLKPVHTFSGVARGADIVLIEETLALGGTPYVILPIPPADFRRVSVGGTWNERFDALIAKLECELLNDTCPPDEQLPDLFQRANVRVQKRAIEYAKALFGTPKVIAVWDGQPGDGAGGTADAVERWQMDGYEVDIIDVSKL
jgi:tetratricopeptide (TPR) repeat protein